VARGVTIALLVAVLILICTLVTLRQMNGVYHIGQAIPLLGGFSVDVKPVELSRDRCMLVRVTSDQCPYCETDRPQYDRLVARARQSSCSIIAVGPRVGDMTLASAGDALPLQYVDLAVGRALMPFRTPQTMIVDATRRLRWQRQGALDDDDLGAALQALDRLRYSRAKAASTSN
jgi:hypothetical protein